jgi:hypothetical protein
MIEKIFRRAVFLFNLHLSARAGTIGRRILRKTKKRPGFPGRFFHFMG